MVVLQHLRQQVERLVVHQMFVVGCDKFLPWLLLVSAKNVIVMTVESNVVLVNVLQQFLSAEDFSNADELVVVVLPLKERFLEEDHSREHAAETPNVERVIVGLEVDQEFRSFEVAGRHSNIILLPWMIVLSQAPINQPQTPCSMIYHDVMWFHISVHDSLRMTEIQGFQYFIDVIPYVEISEALVQSPKVHVSCVNMLHDECRSLGHWVSYDVNEVDNVDSSLQ